MKKITKERLRYIANDIETIEISKITNEILGIALKRTISRNASNEEYVRFCMQEILKRNIYIHFDNSLKHGEIKIHFKNGDVRNYSLLVDK